MSEYFDISPLVSETSAVFPGDQPFRRQVTMAFPRDHLELSSILTSAHVGAHADAPSHYAAGALSIEDRSLEFYLGRCQVIAVQVPAGQRIKKEHVQSSIQAPRVLFATGSFQDQTQWTDSFNSLSPDLIEWLHAEGVKTVGIDTPSIDPADSKDLESHQAIAKRDMAILEGLELGHVPPGVYMLIALPLRWRGVEASPVRAVLLKNWPT